VKKQNIVSRINKETRKKERKREEKRNRDGLLKEEYRRVGHYKHQE
jgi:muconolactone delta-isomerase